MRIGLVAGGAVITGAAVVLAGVAAQRASAATRGLTTQPDPAPDYAGALQRFARMQAYDDATVHPSCRSRLLSHGDRVDRAVVLLHGITTCPQQFLALGESLYRRGHNVLIPRMPYNGIADRKTSNLHPLRAEDLRDYGDLSLDIACGLGTTVTVAGLSVGGVVAAWLAQHRAEVERVVLIAPALGLWSAGRRWRTRMAFFLFPLLPPIQTEWIWKPVAGVPSYTYPGHSTRALGQVLRLSAATFRAAAAHPPGARSAGLVTSQADTQVNRFIAWQLAGLWREHGLLRFESYEFAAAQQVPHDMIDPAQPDQQVDTVYPVLIRMIEDGSDAKGEGVKKSGDKLVPDGVTKRRRAWDRRP